MAPIPESTKQKVLLVALIASVATIPLKNQLNSYAIIFFVAACLIRRPLHESARRLKSMRFWIVPVLYVMWAGCTYFWDTSGGYTLKELERYSILLFVPPAMALVPQISAADIKKACMAFVAVTISVCLICLFKSYSEYKVTGDYRVFYYHYLGEQMHLNAIFLSNYCLASITWILYFGFIQKKRRSYLDVALIIAANLFLLLMILLLSSKLIIFLTLVILIIFILFLGYIKGYFFRSLLIISAIILAGVFAITKLPYLSWRINVTEVKMYKGEQDDQNGIAIRLFMWKNVGELISERPVLGHGLRGARVETLNMYKEKNFELGYNGNYHSHNQYLESWLMAGIPAIILLLGMMFTALWNGIKQKNFLLILIAAHFMIQSLFESTFEVQHELVFYIFFIFLFYYHAPHIRKPEHS